MRHRLLRGVVLAGLLAGAVLALACGGDPAPTSSAQGGDGASTSSMQGASSGGAFRRLWREPPTLDPHEAGDTVSAGIILEVFSGLVTLNTALQVAPDLAERWDVSDDGLTYTFHLRANAAFQNGRAVTAEDIKYSLERATHPDTYAPTAPVYLDDIVGVREKLAGDAAEIAGVRVVDGRTVEITIDSPKAYFLAKLTYPTAFVVDRENLEEEGDDWVRKPNGTGPFVLAEYKIGELIVLERNRNYYGAPALLDRVELILSGGSALAMYENGEIDITGVGVADLDRISNPQEPLNREVVVAPPGFTLSYIGFNLQAPPFDDVNFRRALAYAIDRETIATQVLSDLVTPATGVLPPGFPGYSDAIRTPSYDPAKAQELLAASAYGADPPRITVTIPGTGDAAGLDVQAIIEMWQDTLGLEVELQQVESATFYEDLNRNNLMAYAGIGWQADYPDPQDFLDILFHSESELNHGGYRNAEVDRLVEQARAERDWETRVQLYNEAEQIIVDEVPLLLLWHRGESIILLKPYVRGYALTPLLVPKLRYVWLADR